MYYTLNIEDPNKLFFTSDSHLGHFNITRYCHRPFSSRSEMDRALIDNWNKVVPEDGIVVHCGDFMLPHYSEKKTDEDYIAEYQKIFNKLNGNILHIRGNHDIIPVTTKPQGKLIASVDKAFIIVDGVKIYADHYPSLAFNGDYQVFGHIHTLSDGTCYGPDGPASKKLKPNQYDVGADQNNYTPISYWQLCDIFKTQSQKETIKETVTQEIIDYVYANRNKEIDFDEFKKNLSEKIKKYML